MSYYKSMMTGNNKKKVKKVIKEQSKPKKTVLDGIKQELNEWNDTTFKKMPKRWSGSGLTEFEREGGRDNVNEGPAYEYRKPLKEIEKDLKNFSIEVLDFYELLRGKNLNKEADNLLKIYKKYIIGFNKDFKNFARKLM